MKKIWKTRDKLGGFLEVQVLDRNNKVSKDLIWLHVKRGGKHPKNKFLTKRLETGFVMQPWEALEIIRGLFLAIDYIYDKYGLENFKLKKGGNRKL